MSLSPQLYPQLGLTKIFRQWTAAQWGNAYNMLLLSPLTELSYVAYSSLLWCQGLLWRYAPENITVHLLSYWFGSFGNRTGYKPFFFPKARTTQFQLKDISYRKPTRVGGLRNIRFLAPQRLRPTRLPARQQQRSNYVRHTFFRDTLREFLNGKLRMRTPLYPLKDFSTTVTEPISVRNVKFKFKLKRRKGVSTNLRMRRKSFLRVLLTLSKKVRVYLQKSVGMGDFSQFFRGTTRPVYSTKRRKHLLPRQLTWLNSPTRIMYSQHKGAKTMLFRRSFFAYRRNFKRRNLKLFNKLHRARGFKRGWAYRLLGRRLAKLVPKSLNPLPSLRFRFKLRTHLVFNRSPRKLIRRIRRAHAKRRKLESAINMAGTSSGWKTRRAGHMLFVGSRQLHRWRRKKARTPSRRRSASVRIRNRRSLKRALRYIAAIHRKHLGRRTKTRFFSAKVGNFFSQPLLEETTDRTLLLNTGSDTISQWQNSQKVVLSVFRTLSRRLSEGRWMKKLLTHNKRLPQLYNTTPNRSRALTARRISYFNFVKLELKGRRWAVSRRTTVKTLGGKMANRFRRRPRCRPYYYGSLVLVLRKARGALIYASGGSSSSQFVKNSFFSEFTRVHRKTRKQQLRVLRRSGRVKGRWGFQSRTAMAKLNPSRWLMYVLNKAPVKRRVWNKAKRVTTFRGSRNRRLGWDKTGSSPLARKWFRRDAFLTLLTPIYRCLYLRRSSLVQIVMGTSTRSNFDWQLNDLKSVWGRRPRWYARAYFRKLRERDGGHGRPVRGVHLLFLMRLKTGKTGWLKKLGVSVVNSTLLTHIRPVIRVKKSLKLHLGWELNPRLTSTVFTRLSAQKLVVGRLLGRPVMSDPYYMYSKYRTPFILSNCGFLFVDSMNTMAKAEYAAGTVRARLWKLRLSFFYKNEIKRFYLQRPGRLQILHLFQNDVRGYRFPRFGFSIFRFRNLGLATSTRWPSDGGVQSQDLCDTDRKAFIKYQTNNYLFGEHTSYSYRSEIHIKRIRFKPGYSRIWRRAREALNYSLQYHFRYQHRLTRVLAKLRWARSAANFYFRELVLIRLVQNSRFVYDRHSSRLLILEGLIYLNGCLSINPDVRIFVGDIVQVVISLNYYVIYRWLTNWYFQHTLKLTKYIQYRSNKSRYDLSKQRSSKYPDWLFRSIGRHSDIPKYLEVDFFTLSSFMIYDPIHSLDQSFVTLLENRERIYDMYNWKFIN